MISRIPPQFLVLLLLIRSASHATFLPISLSQISFMAKHSAPALRRSHLSHDLITDGQSSPDTVSLALTLLRILACRVPTTLSRDTHIGIKLATSCYTVNSNAETYRQIGFLSISSHLQNYFRGQSCLVGLYLRLVLDGMRKATKGLISET